MVKSFSNRIAAISMALLILLSSTGFAMDAHYCQDQFKGISFFGNSESCNDQPETSPCRKTKKSCQHQEDGLSQTEKDACCQNESIVLEKSDMDATIPQLATIQDIQLNFVAAFVAVYIFNNHVDADFQPFEPYKPPLPDRDVQVLYQSFLI